MEYGLVGHGLHQGEKELLKEYHDAGAMSMGHVRRNAWPPFRITNAR